MIKIIFIGIYLSVISISLYAQVGIGTINPNTNSLLDVDATTSPGGILLPRLGLSSTTSFAPLSAHVAGMVVYNTATTGDVTPGFYYNNGAAWVRVSDVLGTDKWDTLGNAGTNAGTNFLGTTDNTALRVRTNNANRFEFTTTGRLRSFSAGTSGAPTYSWNSDNDTGLYNIGANILGISTTGAERMRFLANGQATINNTTPFVGDRFTVTGAADEFVINGYSSGAAGVGIYGENATNGYGVWGNVGAGIGVYGTSVGTGQGVRGFNNATGFGVAGSNNSTGIGVIGFSANTGVGVQGQNSGTGRGVIGFSANSGVGVQGQNSGTGFGIAAFNTGNGDGIYNDTTNGWGMVNFIGGNNVGIFTDLTDAGGIGEYIDINSQDGTGFFVDNTNSSDVYGFNGVINTITPTSGTVNGTVYAGTQNGVGHGIILTHSGTQGRNAEFITNNTNNSDPTVNIFNTGIGSGIIAQNQNNTLPVTIAVAEFDYTGTDLDDHVGAFGYSYPLPSLGVGVQGVGGWQGVLGVDNSGGLGYGVFSAGDFAATGTKAFTIDHPLDPENKYLKHFSIESNEVLNLYRGTSTFNADGKVIVKLPNYYDAVNRNPSYQLTPIGAAMPNLFIEKEISNSEFVIAGGVQGKKVSWIVTAERNDPYLQQNPNNRAVEVSKGDRKGKYLNPKLYNQSEDKAMYYTKKENIQANKINETTSLSIKNKKLPNVNIEAKNNINDQLPEKEKASSNTVSQEIENND